VGRMKNIAIDMANEQGVSIEEIVYNKNIDEEYQYEEFKKELGFLNAEKTTLSGGANDSKMTIGGKDGSKQR